MGSITGPWYSLADACEILGIRNADLAYLIEQGHLEAVVFTKARRLLGHLRGAEGSRIGYGTCIYRGHLRLHGTLIGRLLDGDSINLGRGTALLLEPEAVSSWSTKYPYKKPLPHGYIDWWKHADYSVELGQQLVFSPLPTEFYPLRHTVKGHMERWLKMHEQKATGEPDPPLPAEDTLKMELNYEEHGVFEPGDLRIPASEISRYQGGVSEAPAPAEKPYPVKEKRTTQMRELIRKILAQDMSLGAKSVWRIIEQDYDADEPIYDTDRIVEQVDAECITWRARRGNLQSLKFSSFNTAVSEEKRDLKAL